MGAKGVKQLRQHRIIDLFNQAEKEPQLGADAYDRTESPEGGTQVQGVTVQMGRAFGVVEGVRGFVLLRNSRIGFALQLAAPVQEVSKLMQPITHPARILARRLIARNEATATIGGHADAVEVVLA